MCGGVNNLALLKNGVSIVYGDVTSCTDRKLTYADMGIHDGVVMTLDQFDVLTLDFCSVSIGSLQSLKDNLGIAGDHVDWGEISQSLICRVIRTNPDVGCIGDPYNYRIMVMLVGITDKQHYSDTVTEVFRILSEDLKLDTSWLADAFF